MFKLDQYNTQRLDEDRDKWVDIAFPVTIVAIVLGIILPSLLIQLAENFHIILDSFSKVIICIIFVQLLFIIPLMFVAILSSRKIRLRDKLGLVNWKFRYLKDACFYELILIFPLYAIAAIMYIFFSYLGLDTSSPITSLLSTTSTSSKIMIFILSVFFVPFIEEIVFRRLIFTFMNRLFGVLPSVLLTSLVFAVLHGGIVQVIPLMILGIALQLLYLKHNSLYPSILLHSIHNFITMSIFLFLGAS